MAIKFAGVEGQRRVFAALPVMGAALLPKIICAACWPAYTAALGAIGIEFFDYTPYLVPLTIVALVVATGSLALLARRRGRIEPVLLGLGAAAAIVVGKFVLASDLMLYAGIGTLMVASLFPWRSKTAPSCCT